MAKHGKYGSILAATEGGLSWTANAATIGLYDDDLTSYWKMEDVTDGISENDWSTSGTVTFESGKYNNAARMTGSERLTQTHNSDFDLGGDNFYIDWWVKGNYSGIDHPFTRINSSTGYYSFYCYNYENLSTNFYMSSDGTTADMLGGASMGTCPLATWVHLAVARVGTSLRCYNNGSNTSSATSSSDVYDAGSNMTMTMGATGAQDFNGWIDEVGWWQGMSWTTTTQVDSMVTARYNSGTGAFLSS